MSNYKGVMVYGETIEGKLAAITKELLGCGYKLAEALGENLYAVLVGSDMRAAANEAIAFGATKVYIVDHHLLREYQADGYVLSMVKVLKDVMPKVLIMGQTSVGRDLLPRLAFSLDTVAILDCTDLSIDKESGQLLRTKPVYGGKALATFAGDSYPQMATVRVKSQTPAEKDDSRSGEVVRIEPEFAEASIRTKLCERVLEEKKGIKLEDAEVIISGGRGIGGPEGFQQLYELAALVPGAAVGASRSPIDVGWAPSSIQVGLTGKVVSPKVYIACGISGASQHMAGCSGSETIVAINTDRKANMFKEAKFGVVGDWKVVLPVFVKEIHDL
jgi:electron transfer flavoprotein alpha subunit